MIGTGGECAATATLVTDLEAVGVVPRLRKIGERARRGHIVRRRFGELMRRDERDGAETIIASRFHRVEEISLGPAD